MSKEEMMWKGIWNQLQEDKMKPPSQREIKYVYFPSRKLIICIFVLSIHRAL